MKELPTPLAGLRLFELPVFRDERGFFVERFRADRFATFGLTDALVQDNHSRSAPRVLRGLHFQKDPPQAKLVSAVRGAVYDVAVDMRQNSATLGQWFGVELSEENGRVLWVPYGFAHGFCVIGEREADVIYKVNGFYNPKTEGGILWSDPGVGVKWPVKEPLLSPKDAILPLLKNVELL